MSDISRPSGRAAMRAGHSDREFVAERLREAAGDGRIDIEELEERLERAYAARTYADLDALVSDLPTAAVVAGSPEVLKLNAGMSDRKQRGHWVVPPRIIAEAGLASVRIDFTEATCTWREVVVEAKAWMGGVHLIVPEGWTVRTDQVTTGLGSVTHKVTAPPRAGCPTLVVVGHAAMGDVVVRHPRRSRFLPR